MAKSLRSKWRRKCRAVKRERYGKKELERLKKTLGLEVSVNGTSDENMVDISDVVTVTSSKDLTVAKTVAPDENCNSTKMDDDSNKFNPKTLRNEHGTYPIWVHPRKIRGKSKKTKKTLKARKAFKTKSKSRK